MRAFASFVLLAIAAYGCGGSAQAPVQSPADAKPKAAKETKKQGPGSLPSKGIVQAPEGTFGPYLGRAGERALSLWAMPTERGHRWMALPLDASGAPTGAVRDAGAAPDVPPRVVVRAAGDGFVATFTYATGLSNTVATIAFSASGEARGNATTITNSVDPVLYADVVELEKGPVLVYAAQRGEAAELIAVPITAEGKPRGKASVLARDALAWQPVSLGETAALAFVLRGRDRSAEGQVAVVRFDHAGDLVGTQVLVSAESTADPDLDAVRVGDRLVLAWTDRRDVDSRVFVAAMDASGALAVAPRAATPPRGDQAFFGLVASPAHPVALLAWEDLSEKPRESVLPLQTRAVRLGLLGADGVLEPRTATLALAGDDHIAPEFAATHEGWAALTLAPACASRDACEGAPLAPTAVRFDRDLAVVGSEPLVLDAFGGGPASLAWALSCGTQRCTTLVAGNTVPTAVLSMDLVPRASGWTPAAKLDRTPKAPRVVAWDALAAGDRIADIASATVGSGALVAWVTYYAEDAEQQDAKASSSGTAATVALRALDERFDLAGEPTTVSVRAASTGGVSIAAGSPRDGDACLAWAGHDGGQVQVFATRVGKDGKKLAQQMITRAKGAVSDVAVAWAGDGWILAWVDRRDGNGEVYATKIDKQLKRVLPERRLTNAVGDASGVQIAVRGDEVWLAWADARGEAGQADPYAIRLGGKDLQPLGSEMRVAAAKGRARGLSLTKLGDEAALSWIEETETGVDAVAKLVRLDLRGRSLGPTVSVPLVASPTSLALECTAERCRGVTSLAARPGELRIDAFLWDGGATTSAPTQVLTLRDRAADDVAPSLLGDWAFFADDDASGHGRVRRMRMAWE